MQAQDEILKLIEEGTFIRAVTGSESESGAAFVFAAAGLRIQSRRGGVASLPTPSRPRE